jgi:3-oxoacyl-[acyl-carrier protein] reductase
MYKPLAGKNALVTGGSRGIGEGIAHELAKRGANVMITYNSSKGRAEAVVQELMQRYSIQSAAVQAEGTDRDAPQKVMTAMSAQFQRVDVIVNNAGHADDTLLKDVTHEIYDKILDTNLRFPLFLVNAARPFFGPAPRIVNISSVNARMGGSFSGPYTASKAGLEALTKVMAQELGQEFNLTANCVNPGPVDTEMWRSEPPEVHEEWADKIKQTPAGARIATVEDIALIVAFLCDDSSRWSTGSVVNANGGMCFV